MVRLNKNQTMYAKKGMFYSSWNSVMRVLCCDVTGSGELFTHSQLAAPFCSNLIQTVICDKSGTNSLKTSRFFI